MNCKKFLIGMVALALAVPGGVRAAGEAANVPGKAIHEARPPRKPSVFEWLNPHLDESLIAAEQIVVCKSIPSVVNPDLSARLTELIPIKTIFTVDGNKAVVPNSRKIIFCAHQYSSAHVRQPPILLGQGTYLLFLKKASLSDEIKKKYKVVGTDEIVDFCITDESTGICLEYPKDFQQRVSSNNLPAMPTINERLWQGYGVDNPEKLIEAVEKLSRWRDPKRSQEENIQELQALMKATPDEPIYQEIIPKLLMHFYTKALELDAQPVENKTPGVMWVAETVTLAQMVKQKQPVSLAKIDAFRDLLWDRYAKELRAGPRAEEVKQLQMTLNGATMRYAVAKIGEKPVAGYPLYIAMHGGGGCPAPMNDSQWEQMKVYYQASVPVGLYVAVRGVSNDWNLHFRDESYPLYDRLIENLLAFEGVDPNRVYLVGYSAGGDGVYQISARMPDRWAAANMSAGHHNGVSPVNLRNLPLLLQVGQVDGAYNRNKETVKYAMQLDKLAAADQGGYEHEIFVHYQKPHNYLDNHPKQVPQKILANPVEWLEKGTSEVVEKNTNAIAWMSTHVRNPLPDKIVWDLATQAGKRTCKNQFYWLDIGANDEKSLGCSTIVVKADKANNAIAVEKAGNYLRLLITKRMFDLAKPIKVTIDGETFSLAAKPRLDIMAQTLLDRGDRDYLFEAAILLKKQDGKWSATAE